MLASPEQQEIIHLLAANTSYQKNKTFREQLSIFIFFSSLAEIYGGNKVSIHWQIKAIQQHPKENGLPKVLPEEASEMVHFYVFNLDINKQPTTDDFINEQLALNFNVQNQQNSLRHIVSKFVGIKTVTGKPMYEERIRVSLDKIEKYFIEFANIFVQKIPAAFALNADETVYQGK
jgi:hypothetical protein